MNLSLWLGWSRGELQTAGLPHTAAIILFSSSSFFCSKPPVTSRHQLDGFTWLARLSQTCRAHPGGVASHCLMSEGVLQPRFPLSGPQSSFLTMLITASHAVLVPSLLFQILSSQAQTPFCLSDHPSHLSLSFPPR